MNPKFRPTGITLHHFSSTETFALQRLPINGGLTFHESVIELKKAWKSRVKETLIFAVQPLQFGSEVSSNVGGGIAAAQGRPAERRQRTTETIPRRP